MLHANHFRFYPATEAGLTFGSVNSTTARVRRVEKSLDADIESLLTHAGLESLKARINVDDPAFHQQNTNALADCRTAVARYQEVQQWRLAQNQL